MTTMTEGTLDFDARYRLSGSSIAYWLKGYSTTEEYEGDQLLCDDEDCDHQLSELCWAEGDTPIVTDLEWVIAVMVGDDREHLLEVSELTLITDPVVCPCGDTQCGWGNT